MNKTVLGLAMALAGSMVSCIGAESDSEDDLVAEPSSLGGYVDDFYVDDLLADRSAECVRRRVVEAGGSDRGWRMVTPVAVRARYNCASAEPVVLPAPPAARR